MGQVIASASMSLDGFIADAEDGVEHLFRWYETGDVPVTTAVEWLSFQLTPQSAEYWRRWTSGVGALVVGRRLFDIADGWGGHHPMGVPFVVVTHDPPRDWGPDDAECEFVGDVAAGVARAQQIAGDRTVGVAAGTIARQCFDLGLLDRVAVDLVPVFLGTGKPFFGPDISAAVVLDNPVEVVQGDRVLHLMYEVSDRGLGRVRPSS